ncbi:MAG: multidrug effflux MFS transporter, partial [Propylenella sp.]
ALPYAEFVAMIALLMALNAMAIDVILPALQQMGASLAVSDENARQLPLTAYIALFGASQLVCGPVTDRFGRRSVLIAGLVLYALGGIGAALSTSFATLLSMRALQGVGAGATRVIAVAVVRDVYGGRTMARVMSLVMMVFMAVPLIAPSIGQGILMIAGWRWILIFIAASSLAMLAWCWLRLPETLLPGDRRPLRPGPVLEAFRMVVANRIAAAYAFATALMFGAIFGFLNSAQQIYQGIFDVGAAFPFYFSSTAVLMAATLFANARLVERFGMRRLSHGALFSFTATTALLSSITLLDEGQLPFWLFHLLMVVALCQFGFITTNFNAIAMEPLGHVAGTASAVLGSMQTIIGGLVGAMIGYTYDGTVLPLALGFFVLALANILVVAVAERGRFFGLGAT